MTIFSRRSLLAAFAIGFAVAGAAFGITGEARAQTASITDAGKFVQNIGDRAILELTDQKISDAERVSRMRALLIQSFDEEAVSRFVLGVYWNRASEAERSEFTKLYETLVSYTYAGLFKKYSGQTFEVQREREVDGDIVVYAQIVQVGGGQPIPVELLVRPTNGSFRAIDIKVEGISMPLTHRKEYASVIQRNQGQVGGLLKILREKTAQLETAN